MNLLLRAGAMALALLVAAPAVAQNASSVQFPSGWVPGSAPCVKQTDGTCAPVSATNPLPVSAPTTGPATSTPLIGTATSAAVTPSSGAATISGGVATIGPLAPQLGRDIRVILRPAANTTFTFALGTSTDACATINPLTIGGMAWGTFVGAANEAVDTPTVSGVVYCATATVTTGTLTYVVRQ